MSTSRGRDLVEHPAVLWIVSLLTIALFTFANCPWQLEDYDQAKQAFTSWQVVKSGRFFYQDTPGGKVATKPPLAGWTSAVIYEVTRSWDVAWRLPSLSAALVLAWLLWRRATLLFGTLAGIVALVAFSLNLLTPRLSTLVRTDMPLALATFGIALLFFEKIRTREPWSSRGRGALFLLLTASMLIKGPIVYAFVLPAIVWFAWRYRGDLIARSVATGWWPWILSLAIFIIWVVGGIRTVPDFYDEVVLREFVGRFGETLHRPQPLYFYIPHLLHKWGPWSLLLIGLLVVNWRAMRTARATTTAVGATPTPLITPGRGRWPAQFPPENLWLLAWSIGGLIVMSCIPSKRVDRIFPVVPPLCLLLAATVATHSAGKERVARWCAGTLVAAAIFAMSYTGFKMATGFHKQRDALVKCGRAFRLRAAENNWRYAVLRDDTEALVMYLDVPGFISGKEALQRWNAGEIDVLIGSERRMRGLFPTLEQTGEIPRGELCRHVKGEKHYVIVSRRVIR